MRAKYFLRTPSEKLNLQTIPWGSEMPIIYRKYARWSGIEPGAGEFFNEALPINKHLIVIHAMLPKCAQKSFFERILEASYIKEPFVERKL